MISIIDMKRLRGKGFFLVEVTIAGAILATAAVALTSVIGHTRKAQEHAAAVREGTGVMTQWLFDMRRDEIRHMPNRPITIASLGTLRAKVIWEPMASSRQTGDEPAVLLHARAQIENSKGRQGGEYDLLIGRTKDEEWVQPA